MGRLTKQMRMLRVAHRGASETRPENTIPAYVKACVDGADVVEVDVRKTCDGAWVAIHDPNVDRTTDATGEVAGMSLAALRRLDAGASFSPEYRGTRVPTLSEVYEAVAGRAALLLDVKADGHVSDLLDQIEAIGAEMQTVLGLRKAEHIKAVSNANPNVRLLGFIPRPHHREIIRAYIDSGADIIRLWLKEANEDLIECVHSRGKAVWIMAGDIEPADVQRLAGLGCDGVLLNNPLI